MATLETTRRGMNEKDHDGFIASAMTQVLKEAIKISKEATNLRHYATISQQNEKLSLIKQQVTSFTSEFGFPGLKTIK